MRNLQSIAAGDTAEVWRNCRPYPPAVSVSDFQSLTCDLVLEEPSSLCDCTHAGSRNRNHWPKDNSFLAFFPSHHVIRQNILTALAGGNSRADGTLITDDARKTFDLWYFQQVLNRYRQVVTLTAQAQQQQATVPSSDATVDANHNQQHPLPFDVVESFAKAAAAAQLKESIVAKSRSTDKMHPLPVSQQLPLLLTNQLHSGSQQPPTQSLGIKTQQSSNATGFVRTRIRTSFDPELELPKLHKWFSENQHPSRTQVHQYVEELNALESRRGRKPLDSNNVVYWFKNARAAHKRQELKGVNGWTGNSSNGSSTPTNKHLNQSSEVSRRLQNKNKSDLTAGDIRSGHNGDHEEDEDEDSMQNSDDRLDESGDENDDDESDSSFAFPQTLDLSVRQIKRQRVSHSMDRITAAVNSETRIKDEVSSDPDDEDEEAEEEEDYYYTSPTHQSPGAGFYPPDGIASAGGQHNGHNNSHTYSFDSSLSCNTSPSNNNNHIVISSNPNSPDNGSDGRSRVRRSRTFIDPMSEVPRLEQWFGVNTHPTHSQIVRYTEELNRLQYRQKFPRLEPKNIQFWFKNRRAKYKRLSLPPSNSSLTPFNNNNNNNTCQVNNNNGPNSSSRSPNSAAAGLLPAASVITSTSSSNGLSCSVTTTSSPPAPPQTANMNKNPLSNATPILTSALNIDRLISN